MNQLLDYPLMIYVCSGGTDREKLNRFRIVNIAGVELTEQENRNIVYTGAWLTAAKSFFSKKDCAAKQNYGDYLKGSAIRQDYPETALKWIADRDASRNARLALGREFVGRRRKAFEPAQVPDENQACALRTTTVKCCARLATVAKAMRELQCEMRN